MRTKLALLLTLMLAIAGLFWLTRGSLDPASLAGRALPLGMHTLHADDATLQQAHDLGAAYVVQVFAWSEIEPTRGEFHWEYTDWLLRAAEYYHLQVIARLDRSPRWATSAQNALDAPPDNLQDYDNFVARVADRYRGRIAAYVIWNEPNLAREWGNRPPDPAAYAALLKSAAARLRATDPTAHIVSAGLAPTNDHDVQAMDDRDFLRAMYAAGARGAFDILAAHPYGFANPPDDPRGAHAGLNFLRLLDVRDIMIANGDAAKPTWITEFGYTIQTSADTHVTEDEQAQFLSRAYEIAREQIPFVQVFTVWNLASHLPPTDAQAGYSLLRADGSPETAYATVRAMQKESPAASLAASVSSLLSGSPQRSEFTVLARDAIVHLGEKEYPSPWVPLYHATSPSTVWTGELYLRAADLQNASPDQPWRLTMELMQVNDLDNRVLVNGQPVNLPYLPIEDFTSIWVAAQYAVSPSLLHIGHNTVTLLDGKLFPAFQQLGYTWDDFQVRNVVLHRPN